MVMMFVRGGWGCPCSTELLYYFYRTKRMGREFSFPSEPLWGLSCFKTVKKETNTSLFIITIPGNTNTVIDVVVIPRCRCHRCRCSCHILQPPASSGAAAIVVVITMLYEGRLPPVDSQESLPGEDRP